ncbi:hypothetical protein ACIG0C_24825 [Kitasatospora aureofaciens]|uniref:Uncharacterized protein n=1 Tax=Kitasatospora aureofaciens TaxID=1894 RepID=A0A1E7N8R8_KITAU|nr:hypothetical protein [Kitasatospora aureofaciens]OEV37095.1 hypothetical protein HS99_0004555 [Kitasatospora aureofaciens]UKZ03320.1 hypothetical protein BOQ63_004220 [Streptomyces viridifaciens]
MDTSSDAPVLGDVLLGFWSARDRFLEAGLATNRSDPIGGLAESLAAAAFWSSASVRATCERARGVRTGIDRSGEFGPALGSMPVAGNGRRNSLAVDLAVPWRSLVERVPTLADFARQRQGERWAWDVASGGAYGIGSDGPPQNQYAGLARLQVKARFAPDAPSHGPLDAVPFELVRDGPVPANDLYVLVMFARIDEEYRDLRAHNFVWTAVIVTNECLRALDHGVSSAKLDWKEIHSWWGEGRSLPAGVHDVTGLLRSVPIPGW